MTAFVLGNGISRSLVDVNALLKLGPVYGCNALYRTHTPTVLVATDAPIAKKIQESGYALTNRFYTRRPMPKLGANPLTKKYFGFSSGPNAVALAAIDKNIEIYLLGFDLGPTQSGTFNNMYASTEFYKTANSEPTHAGNWVKQIISIAQEFRQCVFTRVHGETTANVPEFDKVPNINKMDLVDFVQRINKPKDL